MKLNRNALSLLRGGRLKKFFLIMKLTWALILFLNLQMSASIWSQTATMSVKLKNSTLQELFTQIEKGSDYRFFYNNDEVDITQKISVSIDNQSIGIILTAAFKGLPYSFKESENMLIVVEKFGVLPNPSEINSLQKRVVTGTVNDQSGSPIPGVTVLVKGTTTGVTTANDGKFSLMLPTDAKALVFSFVGMKTQEVNITGKSEYNIVLSEEIHAIDEVVAIGYGTTRKRDLTGAVSSVKMDDLKSRPMNNFGDALQGQIAGVQVVQHTGAPGSSPTIQVRGLTSITAGQVPLLVIDGVPMTSMLDLSDIDPMEIKSVEVLKDASAAAIYGSRGGSGVVLVTTKRAGTGKSSLNVNYTFSMQTLGKRLPYMNSQEYIAAMKAASQNAWVDKGGDPNAANTLAARGNIRYTWPTQWDDPNIVAKWPTTDWQDVTYQNAPMHKINISGSGSFGGTSYYISGSYLDQVGMIDVGHRYKRLFLNAKIDTKVTEWLKVGLNLNERSTRENQKPVAWIDEQMALEDPPIFPYITEQGFAGGAQTLGNDSRYPVTTPAMNNYEGIYFTTFSSRYAFLNNIDKIEDNKFIATAWAELNLMEGLTFKSSYTNDQAWSQHSAYNAVYNNLPSNLNNIGGMSRDMGRTNHWYFENLLSFKRAWGEHSFNVVAGHVAEKTNYLGFSTSAQTYGNDVIPYLSAAQTPTSAGDTEYSTTFESYIARFNYVLSDKYLVTGTISRDGSSRFGTNFKFGNFPSIAFGWNVSDEPFMSSLKAKMINNMKLRASYGFSGNNNFSDYVFIPSLSQGSAVVGGGKVQTYQKSNLPNPELKWERTGQFNIGIDISAFNERVNLVFDYFKSRNKDLLLNLPVSSLTGFNSLLQNIGEVENKGMELSLTTRNMVGEFNWTSTANFSFDRGKVINLGGQKYLQPGGISGMEIRSFLGDPLFQYFGYKYIGTFKDQADILASPSYAGAKPGNSKYKDIDLDGKITSADRTILGSPQPDFVWSLNNNLSWKGFDFSVLLTSVVGGEKVNVTRRRHLWYQAGRNFYTTLNDMWSPTNTDSYYFKLSVDQTSMDKVASSYWIEDASYIKLKDITIGYTLPTSLTRKFNVQTVRVYLNGSNLKSWTKFIGFDPEEGAGGSKHYDRGSTFNEYAIPRTFSGGINVTF
jgi:TonB-linked SusC/RagA family outer membrane protein